jgi:hypothetical protein
MRALLLLFLLTCFHNNTTNAQNPDEKSILRILDDQTKYWNQGDIDGFVKGYWKNDSLMFIGQSGITYGYQNTINNYKKNYSDTAKMGTLHFEIIKLQKLSGEYYFVVGKWFLKRSVGDLKGMYTLLFRKINNEWVIIVDHSS